jgi:hypothetical protein
VAAPVFVQKYSLSQVLVIADYEEKYGENWLICLTEDAFHTQTAVRLPAFVPTCRARVRCSAQIPHNVTFNSFIQEMDRGRREEEEARRLAEEAAEAARAAKEELERRVYEVLPLIARPYASATAAASDVEVQRLTVRPSRQPVKMSFMRRRREFGHAYTFSDKDVDGSGCEFRGRRAPEYSLVRAEMDIALQDCPGMFSGSASVATQTQWNRLVCVCACVCVYVCVCVCVFFCLFVFATSSHASGVCLQVSDSCQTDPISSTDIHVPAGTDAQIQAFLSKVLPVCEHALQQNETLNIFKVCVAL